MPAAFRAAALTKHFGSTRVLDGLNLEIAEGSVYGLLGPNGAGKTTTIKILMNILQPASGRAEVLGTDSRRLTPNELSRIGYVSENQEMPLWMTTAQLLAYLKPFYPTWDEGRAAALVRDFDLPPKRPLRHLSRGMFMKAALASSLAYRPHLLVLDEPFSGLDPVVREDLLESLRSSAGETTILVSSHDLAEVESFASHIGYLDQGRLRFSEELTSLTERFREIVVPTTEAPLAPWPATWLAPQTTPHQVRFVDSRFHPEGTAAEIQRVFGQARQPAIAAMPLRTIFLTLARKSPTEAARAASPSHLS